MSLSSQIQPEPEKPTEVEVPKEETGEQAVASVVPAAAVNMSSTPVVTAPSPSIQVVSPPSQYDLITEALLSKIGDIGGKSNLKLGIYGDPGTTKSSFAGTAPNNLIIDLEDGLIAAKTAQHYSGRPLADNVKAFPYNKFLGAEELVKRFADHHPALEQFDVLTIDTISDMHKRELQNILDREWMQRPDSVNRFDPDSLGKDKNPYVEVNQMLSFFLRTLRDLDRDLIVLAHGQTVEPKGKPSKTYFDFSEKLTNKLMAMLDIVGYMTRVEVPDGKGGVVEKPMLRVISEGTIYCKTRIPLPATILDPTFGQIKDAWNKAIQEGSVSEAEPEPV